VAEGIAAQAPKNTGREQVVPQGKVIKARLERDAFGSNEKRSGTQKQILRFLQDIEIPASISSSVMSDQPATPDPGTGEARHSRRSSLKSVSTPATPERRSVTFANPLQPHSPGSVRPAQSGASNITYKSRVYTIELQMRGILESEEYPPQFDSMTKILESRRQGHG
jgi:hypothetical protein